MDKPRGEKMSSSALGQRGEAQTKSQARVVWWSIALEILYGGLFAAVVIAIDPWGGANRGPIWTRPKVFMVIFLTLITWGYLLYRWLLPGEAEPEGEDERQRMLGWQIAFATVLTLIGWVYLLLSRFIPGSFSPELIGDNKLFVAAIVTVFAWGVVLFSWLARAREVPGWTDAQHETSFVTIFTTLVWGYLLAAPYLSGALNLEPTRNQLFVALMFTLLAWGVVLLRWLMAAREMPERAEKGAGSASVTSRSAWRGSLILWMVYLALGLLSVYLSPSPTSALRAQVEMGDGWYYWAIVGAFTLGNILLLSLNPRLFKVQLYGVLLGSFILALSLVPQAFDWTIDYTATSGERAYANKLRSGAFITWMPIGLYSHRGHAAVVLAFAGVLALLSLLRGWLRPALFWPLFVVLVGGVYLTSSRGPQFAFIVGLLYLLARFPLARFWRRSSGQVRALLALMIPVVLGSAFLLVLTAGGGMRRMPSLDGNWDDISSGRTYLWRTGYAGVKERPLFGWGFNGFGLSWPFVADWEDPYRYGLIERLSENVPVQEVLEVNNYNFTYIGTDGERRVGRAFTNKAHNLFLDTILSVGIVGFAAYLLLIGYFIYLTGNGPGRGLEVVALVHLVYCLAWFDTAQFSHLVWWSLSAGVALATTQQVRSRSTAPSDTNSG